jgi:lysophospholipase L1-like esterase
VGYLHSPGVFSIVDHCKSEDVEFERRVASLAARTRGFYYLNVSDLAGKGDRSFHSADRIHPSVKGSRAVARLIANLIAEEGS